MIAYLRKPGNWENFLRILPALLSRNIKSVPRMNQVELFYLITKRPFILTRLDDSSVWYIVDGRDPDIVEAKTILTCSPLKAHYKEFNKKIPTVRYMSVWSWNEINICRSELFKTLVLIRFISCLKNGEGSLGMFWWLFWTWTFNISSKMQLDYAMKKYLDILVEAIAKMM